MCSLPLLHEGQRSQSVPAFFSDAARRRTPPDQGPIDGELRGSSAAKPRRKRVQSPARSSGFSERPRVLCGIWPGHFSRRNVLMAVANGCSTASETACSISLLCNLSEWKAELDGRKAFLVAYDADRLRYLSRMMRMDAQSLSGRWSSRDCLCSGMVGISKLHDELSISLAALHQRGGKIALLRIIAIDKLGNPTDWAAIGDGIVVRISGFKGCEAEVAQSERPELPEAVACDRSATSPVRKRAPGAASELFPMLVPGDAELCGPRPEQVPSPSRTRGLSTPVAKRASGSAPGGVAEADAESEEGLLQRLRRLPHWLRRLPKLLADWELQLLRSDVQKEAATRGIEEDAALADLRRNSTARIAELERALGEAAARREREAQQRERSLQASAMWQATLARAQRAREQQSTTSELRERTLTAEDECRRAQEAQAETRRLLLDLQAELDRAQRDRAEAQAERQLAEGRRRDTVGALELTAAELKEAEREHQDADDEEAKQAARRRTQRMSELYAEQQRELQEHRDHCELAERRLQDQHEEHAQLQLRHESQRRQLESGAERRLDSQESQRSSEAPGSTLEEARKAVRIHDDVGHEHSERTMTGCMMFDPGDVPDGLASDEDGDTPPDDESPVVARPRHAVRMRRSESAVAKRRTRVRVKIVSASHLRAGDVGGFSDPFVTVAVIGRPGPKFTTSTIKKTLDPVWNEETIFDAVAYHDCFLLEVWDQDPGKHADFLGSVKIPPDLYRPMGFEGSLHLEYEVKKGISPFTGKAKSIDSTVNVVMDVLPLLSNQENGHRLFVRVLNATGLRAADKGRKSDPYVVVSIPGKPASKFRTKYKVQTLCPEWNEESEIQDYCSGDPILFTVWDKDVGKEDDFLGEKRVENSIFALAGFSGALQLERAGDGKDAKLIVEIDVT